MVSLIGAAFCFISSVSAVYQSDPVSNFTNVYRQFLNLDMAHALDDGPEHEFIWNELSQRLLPTGELVRSMPYLATRMSEADEQNRATCLQLGRFLDSYHPEIVPHNSPGDMFTEYDTNILPALHETFASLVNETQLVREDAGIFAASCKRNKIDQLIAKFDRIFRASCQIHCKLVPMRNRTQEQPTDCILKRLASDHEYRKQNVTPRVQQYDRNLVILLITTIFCDYSHAEEFGNGCDLKCTVSRHTAQIKRIADHMFEYVNWKMDEAWPNVSSSVAKISLDEYVRNNVSLADETDYNALARFIQERLNEIGDYRHTYQVLISDNNTQSFVSTNTRNVLHFIDRLGVDCLVVRHKVGAGTIKRAERAHEIMASNHRTFIAHLENCKFRPENIAADLKDLGRVLNLTLLSELTYSTVVVEQSGQNGLFDGIAFSGRNNYWVETHSKHYRYCKLYSLLFFL